MWNRRTRTLLSGTADNGSPSARRRASQRTNKNKENRPKNSAATATASTLLPHGGGRRGLGHHNIIPIQHSTQHTLNQTFTATAATEQQQQKNQTTLRTFLCTGNSGLSPATNQRRDTSAEHAEIEKCNEYVSLLTHDSWFCI